jgi:hypothetical protein
MCVDGLKAAARYGYCYSTVTIASVHAPSAMHDHGGLRFVLSTNITLLFVNSLMHRSTSHFSIFGYFRWPTRAKQRKNNIDRNTDTIRTQDKQASLRHTEKLASWGTLVGGGLVGVVKFMTINRSE